MSLSKIQPFTPDYREACFDAWFMSGCPAASSTPPFLPDSVDGRRPSVATVSSWMESDNWHQRAEELNTQARALVNKALVTSKADLLKHQFEIALALAKKAADQLLTDKIDNSNAAVQLYFKATSEARQVMGISEFMEKVGHLTEQQLQEEIATRLERLGVTDPIPLDEDTGTKEKEKLENKAQEGVLMDADT